MALNCDGDSYLDRRIGFSVNTFVYGILEYPQRSLIPRKPPVERFFYRDERFFVGKLPNESNSAAAPVRGG